jgi:hypothetical protein
VATLTAQDVSGTSSVTPTYTACDVAGDQVANDGKILLHFKNTNASARNVTIDSVTACNQGSDHNIVVNVPATTGDKMVGPFDAARFTNATGFLTWTYDAVTNLTVAVLTV